MRGLVLLATLLVVVGLALPVNAALALEPVVGGAPGVGVLRDTLPVDGTQIMDLLASPHYQFDRTLYLVTDTALCRSTDGGGSWLEAANLPDAGARRFTAAALVDTGAHHYQLLLTTAGGQV